MNNKPNNKNRIEHILYSIENINNFVNGLTFEQFQSDKILIFAVIKNIENIGEATANISTDFIKSRPEINWNTALSMRHHIESETYQISDKEAWLVIQHDLQPLKEKLEAILKTL